MSAMEILVIVLIGLGALMSAFYISGWLDDEEDWKR